MDGRRFRRPPVFFLRRIGVGHFTTLARHFGGAMAEAKAVVNGSKVAVLASVASAGKQADPEIGQAGAAQCLQLAAHTWLLDNVKKIIDCLAKKIEEGDLRSVQMMLDFALKLPADMGLAEKQVPSFAAELWELSKTLLLDAGE
jgi:hypothetical protein